MGIAVEPGSRLAGRYRVDHPVVADGNPRAAAGGSAYWIAQDGLLNRAVGLRLLPADAPHAGAVLDAARRAAAVEDQRFLAILDADRCDGFAYVVSEWVDARDLVDLLARGPLPDAEARWLAAEVAGALGVAHAAGLAHRLLVPEAVLHCESGRVKVAGLAVDAALHGLDPAVDPTAEAADLRAAGAVLYAGLTGRWPLHAPGTRTRLMPAPVVDRVPCSPRQVRAAVPAELDELACRALGVGPRRGPGPLRSPGDLAAALTGSGQASGEPGTGPLTAVPDDPDVPLLAARDRPGPAARAAIGVATALMALGLGLLTLQVMAATGRPDPAPQSTADTSRSDPMGAASPGVDIPVVAVADFDPEGDNGREHPEEAGLAIDGDPETVWTTEEYYNAPLGGLKSGVGLRVDLGAARTVRAVAVELSGRGSDVELRAAPPGEPLPSDASGYEVLDRAEQVGAEITLQPTEPVRARHLLIWFTSLPPSGAERYQGGIAEVRVRG